MSASRPASSESAFVIFKPNQPKDQRYNWRFLFTPLALLFGIATSPQSFVAGWSMSVEVQAGITATANLVLLPVNVTDAHGTAVEGLKMQNFRVYEDGQAQQLTVFNEADKPVTVGLVVDHSRSMGPKLPDVAAAISSFAHSSNSQDEMFVVDFNDDVSIELMRGKSFSNDPAELGEALTAVSARGRTALYDALGEGLQHLQYGRWTKKALVIVSDGGDNASRLTYSQVLARARQSQASIYAIALFGPDDADENPRLLLRLCRDTGGTAYFPSQSQSVGDVSREIARDLREQYTLGYVPQNPERTEAFRKIEVKVWVPGHGKVRVRTRQGYSLAASTLLPGQPESR
jgi:Ca-activated chloride channel family protein